jgi:hypothetical protein
LLVQFVLRSHVVEEFSLVSCPSIRLGVGDLSEELSGVSVVKTKPCVVVSENISSLLLVKENGLFSAGSVSLSLVVCILRSFGKSRDEEITPVGHRSGNLGVHIVEVQGVESNRTGTPLLGSKLNGSAVIRGEIAISAVEVGADVLVDGSEDSTERSSIVDVHEGSKLS